MIQKVTAKIELYRKEPRCGQFIRGMLFRAWAVPHRTLRQSISAGDIVAKDLVLQPMRYRHG